MTNAFNPAVFVEIRFAMIAPYSDTFLDPDVARAWLDKRIPIFQRICAPGLANQTVQPDAILIGMAESLQREAGDIVSFAPDHLPLMPAFQKNREANDGNDSRFI